MKRRRILNGAAALILVLSMAGCGQKSADGTAAGGSAVGAGGQESAAAGAKIAEQGDTAAGAKAAEQGNPASEAKNAKQAAEEAPGSYADLDTSFNVSMEARFSPDGTTGYIPIGNGECVELRPGGRLISAAISPNRQWIAVRLSDGSLYITDAQQKHKAVVSLACGSSRVYPSDTGAFYIEKVNDEKHLMRYTFEDGATVDLGACTDAVTSDGFTAMAGFVNGELCVLSPGSDEIRRYPVSGSGELDMNAVSDDGNTVVWTGKTEQYQMEKLYALGDDGKEQSLGDIQVRGFVHTNFSADGQIALVTSEEVNHLFVKNASGQWSRVELPGDLKNETGVYETDAGLLHKANAEEIHYIYVRCGTQLCAVSVDGSLTVVQGSVRDFDIVDGVLYYSDTEKRVYAAKLNGAEAAEAVPLLEGVDTFAVSPGGNYLYSLYVHEDTEKVRSLSVYPLNGEQAGELILSENIYADEHIYLSAESESVFYVDDTARLGDSDKYIGTLKVYHADTGETETIDEEVYKNAFTNGKEEIILSEYAQSLAGIGKFTLFHGNLMYRKKPEGNEDGSLFDWYYYDGTESVRMAENLDY